MPSSTEIFSIEESTTRALGRYVLWFSRRLITSFRVEFAQVLIVVQISRVNLAKLCSFSDEIEYIL